MGKGYITANLEEGKYTVEIDTGSAKIQTRIDKLTADIVRWTAAKATADADLATISAARPPLLASLDSAIAGYRAALNSGVGVEEAKNAVNAAVQEVFKYEIKVQAATIPTRSYDAQITQAQRQIAYLSGFDLETVSDLWCADLTDDAAIPGNYALIEIPGEPAQTLIAPSAPTYSAADGVVTARPAQSAEQLYLNLALLPGWQKFSPTYRTGVITNLQTDIDTTDVFLDSAESSAQGLSINQDSALYGVPVEYMHCHAAAFANGDRVVVRFDGQDWSNPKVIGFESHPKMCPVGRARLHRPLDGRAGGHPDVLWSQFYLNVKGEDDGGPGTEIINYMRSDALLSTFNLCVEYRMEGAVDFIKMVQDGYHSPAPLPAGPLGAIYRGPTYGAPDFIDDGEVWLDDFYRFDELGDDSGLPYDCAYGSGGVWDKTWKLHLGLNTLSFPGYLTKYIEIRIHRNDDLKTPPIKKLIHFIYKFDAENPLVWGVEDIDALITFPTFYNAYGDGKPITKYPDSFPGFPQPQPKPDYW
jgi:hypothetical protein